jgi:hypothetical protein
VKDVKKMERARKGEQTVLEEGLGVEGGRPPPPPPARDEREREKEERERSKR